MGAAPLVGCECAKRGPDDQGQGQGRPSVVVSRSLSLPQYLLIVRALQWNESLLAGDPTDGCVQLDEPLRLFVSALVLLHSECVRGPFLLVLGRSWLAPRPVCVSLS